MKSKMGPGLSSRLCGSATKIAWLVQLMNDLNQPVEYSVTLYCDNQSLVHLAKNPIFHASTKHDELHYTTILSERMFYKEKLRCNRLRQMIKLRTCLQKVCVCEVQKVLSSTEHGEKNELALRGSVKDQHNSVSSVHHASLLMFSR